jgi:hypothetical protein
MIFRCSMNNILITFVLVVSMVYLFVGLRGEFNVELFLKFIYLILLGCFVSFVVKVMKN